MRLCDGARLYVTNAPSGTVSVIDTGTNTVVATILVGVAPFDVTISLDGARGYVEEPNEFLDVIDTASNMVVSDLLQANTFHDHLAITTDGTRLYATAAPIKKVAVLDNEYKRGDQ